MTQAVRFELERRPLTDLSRVVCVLPTGCVVSRGPWVGMMGRLLGFPRRFIASDHGPRTCRVTPGREVVHD